MKNFIRIAGTLSLVAAISTVIMFKGSGPAAVATQQQQDQRKEKLQGLRIQTFGGESVLLRAHQLSKYHKGIARAMKDAEKRGLRPAFDQGTVILATDPAKTTNPNSVARANLIRPVSFRSASVQDTFTQDGYEITFIPYDDGDPNTWEGIIYRAGPDIGEATDYAVINISTDAYEVVQDIYYSPDGGDPEPILLLSKQSKPGQPNSKETLTSCNNIRPQAVSQFLSTKVAMRWTNAHPQCPQGWHVCLGAQAGECCNDQGLPGVNGWIRRSVGYCSAAAIGCTASGPAWAHCFGAWCTGGMVAALFG